MVATMSLFPFIWISTLHCTPASLDIYIYGLSFARISNPLCSRTPTWSTSLSLPWYSMRWKITASLGNLFLKVSRRGGRCSKLINQKNFFLKNARQLASTDYWLKYKRLSAKLHQVVRDSNRQFWDSVFRNANDLRILNKVFRKFKSHPYSHFCLIQKDFLIPEAAAQSELFADHASKEAIHEPLLIDYGYADRTKLSFPFKMSELTEAIRRVKTIPWWLYD